MNCTSKLFIGLALSATMISCGQRNTTFQAESNSNLVGLATPLVLSTGVDSINVQDYFLNKSLIDSVSFSSGEVSLSLEKDYFIFKGNSQDPISLLKVHSGDTIFSLIVKRSDKTSTEFVLSDTETQYKSVSVKGDFNAWNPQMGRMTMKEGKWSTAFDLEPGQYQYKFVVDGMEITDQDNADSMSNSFGAYNSVKNIAQRSALNPTLLTKSYSNTQIILSAENVSKVIALWQNQEIVGNPVSEENYEFELDIPAVAKSVKRSYIRVLGMNEYNKSNDLLIPMEYGKVVNSTKQLDRSDWHSGILYFMMVDRFNNGNTSNDAPLNIPEVLAKADYFGGDIKGITEKIRSGYFKELGINSVWLSPIVQNPEGPYGLYPNPKTKFSAYHGYWPTSFSKIDYRLGNPEELKELVALAHENDLNVLIDFVANHVHIDHWVYKEHPDWATDLYLPDGSLNTERWDEYRLTTWFDTHLPTLDLTNPVLTDMLTDSAVFWLKEYDLDGFRHDATKHVPEYFWRELTKKIKRDVSIPRSKVIYQIGETYGSRELIASYVSSGQMNAQFDFGVYDDALPAFVTAETSFTRVQTSISESLKYYGSHHLMGNITGNQDKPRFMAYAGGDLKFEEDSKLAGWTREISVTNPIGYEKLKMFLAFNFTIPGIPVIYYGDEIGMTGANDPDNRRQMRFDLDNPEEIEVKGTVARLSKLRRSNLEFIYGDFTWLLVDEQTMAFARSYFNKVSVVVFNKSDKESTIQVKLPEQFSKSNFVDETQTVVENANGYLSITIQPLSFQIIQSK